MIKNFLQRPGAPLAVFLLLCAVTIWLPGITVNHDCASNYAGEALFFGIPHDNLAWCMPLQLVLLSALKLHLSPQGYEVVTQALGICVPAIMFVLALQFGSVVSAAIVVCVAAIVGNEFTRVFCLDLEQLLYTLTLLLLALALALKRGNDTPRSNWTVAFLLGIGTMIRSPIYFFALVLLAHEILAKRTSQTKPVLAAAVRSAPLFILPLLMLAPRMWMIWKSEGMFSLFESTRLNNALITTALGMVVSVDHPLSLVGLEKDSQILSWFWAQAAAHPSLLIAGLFKRFYTIFTVAPLLFVAAGAALLRFRKSETLIMSGLMCAFFVAFYSALALELRYLIPLCALTLSMTAALPSPALGTAELPATPAVHRNAGLWTIRLAVGILLLLYVSVSMLMIRYPACTKKFLAAPYAVAQAHPASDWVQYSASRLSLANGDISQARHFGMLALRQRPAEPIYLKQYLLTLISSGINVAPELGKLHRSEATGITNEGEEASLALPKLLNCCIHDRSSVKKELSALLFLKINQEQGHLAKLGTRKDSATINTKQLNEQTLDMIRAETLYLPPARRCSFAICLQNATERSGDMQSGYKTLRWLTQQACGDTGS